MSHSMKETKCPIHSGRFNSTELGGLSTKNITGEYTRNIDLKDTWFNTDLKYYPNEVTDK